jgi:dCTP deaminase
MVILGVTKRRPAGRTKMKRFLLRRDVIPSDRVIKVSFISKEEIMKRFESLFDRGDWKADHFSKSGASYDLSLGEEALVTPKKETQHLQKGETVNIDSGQFAVLTTEEYFKMPDSLLGFITVRFQYKSKGLVNISGFHVDPGFEGRLVFSVYNAGPATVTLRRGERVFSVFFAELYPKTSYSGGYNKQTQIPLEIVETFAGARVPSLQALEDRVNRNWTAIKIYGTILTGLVVTVIGALLRIVLGL